MIPYFSLTVIPVGPLHIQVWGLFVAVGMGAAILFGRRVARRRGLSADVFVDFSTIVIIAALVGARLFHAVAYSPETFIADPLRLLRLWEGGFSSVGGFAGAALGAWWYARRFAAAAAAAKVPGGSVTAAQAPSVMLPYVDVAVHALPLGYGLGRIGCFLIHDHPGTLSHSILAVQYPDGPRLDHGLLLSLVGFALFAWFCVIERRAFRRAAAEGTVPPAVRGFLPLFLVSYGSVRFVLDFFRAQDLLGADARYAGLTPAQYVALAMVAAGAVLLTRRGGWLLGRRRRGSPNTP